MYEFIKLLDMSSTYGVLHLCGILVYLRHSVKRYHSWNKNYSNTDLRPFPCSKPSGSWFRATYSTNSNPDWQPRTTPGTPPKSTWNISKNLTSIFFRFINVFQRAHHHAQVELAKLTHLGFKIISIRQVVPKIRNILLYSHILEKVRWKQQYYILLINSL